MQKRLSLRAEFCRSGAAEETSRIFWIMIELTNLLHIFRVKLGKPQHNPENKGKQAGSGCGGQPARASAIGRL